jgi:catalase
LAIASPTYETEYEAHRSSYDANDAPPIVGTSYCTKQAIDAKKQQEKLEQTKKTTTEQAAQDKKARYQKAFNDFLLLPENKQEELKQAFFEKSDSVIKMQIKEAQRKGIDIFTSPLVSSPFKVFLVENGF